MANSSPKHPVPSPELLSREELIAEIARLKSLNDALENKVVALSSEQTSSQPDEVNDPFQNIPQTDDLFKVIIHDLPDFVFYKNLAGEYLFGNQAFAKNYGLTATEIIGKTDFDLLPPDIARQFRSDDLAVLESGEPLKKETRVSYSSGYFDLILTIKIPVKDDKGKVIGLMGFARDISELKQREKELSNSLDDIASHAQQLNLLYRLAEKVSRSHSMHEAYRSIAQNSSLITRSDGCSLTSLNDNGVSLSISRMDRGKGLIELDPHLPITESIFEEVISSCKPKTIGEEDKEEIELMRQMIDRRLQTMLIVPLVAHEKVIGTFNIYRNHSTPFTRWEEQLTTQIANHLAITYENMRLLRKTRDQLEQLQISQLERDDLLLRLEEHQNFLVSVLDSIPAPVYVKDTDGRFLLVNKAYQENIIPKPTTKDSNIKSGIADWIGKSVFDIIEDPNHAQRYHIHDQALFESPGVQKYEIDVGYADNSRRDVIFYKSTYTDNLGEVGGLVGTILDISERKAAEKKIKEREEELKNILDEMPIAIGILNATKAIYVNAETCKLFGGTREELLKIKPSDLYFNPEDRQWVISSYQAGQGPSNLDLNLKKLDGTLLPVNLSMHSITLADEPVFLAVMYDLTTRQQTEQLLIEAKEEAIAASKMKSEFLSNMSHELRTPMNGVLGMTSLLMNTELDSEQQEIVTTIRNSGDALLTIISEILDFSKIEAGKLEIEPVEHSLRTAIETSIDLVSTKAIQKGLSLAYLIDRNVPKTIIQDETRIRQILANLLSNAVKFTESGSITIHVSCQAYPLSAGLKQVIQFAVKDSGIGIPENRLHRLFQSFSQVDASTTRRFGGTGLGLAISKRLAELLGGDMWVESKTGVGSTFFFTVLATKLPDTKPTEAEQTFKQQLESSEILLIEPDGPGRNALAHLMDELGNQPTVLSPTLYMSRPQPLSAFDIVLIDHTVASRILENKSADDSTSVIVSAPIGTKLDRQLANQHILYRPYKYTPLIETLANVLNGIKKKRQTGRLNPFNTQQAQTIPLRILLAEDNVVNQKVALGILKRHGYAADLAANGLEAVTAIKDRPYDVILMDVNMPEMDGIEASEIIRQEIEQDLQPHIIALTANAFQEDKKRLLENGLMDDYVSKPVSVEKLMKALAKVKVRS